MATVIIDYGSGNLHSARKAVERAAFEAGLTETVQVSSDPDAVRKADRVILPGVGAFADCRRGLDSRPGLLDAMREAVLESGTPFLGICVGMQLLAERGYEHEVADGLGWIDGSVVALEPAEGLRVPHMGWNTLTVRTPHHILDGIPTGPNGLHAYFVHSFQFKPRSPELVIAETDYGGPVTAIVGRDNIVGSQFHPEKSQKLGLAFLSNFLRWRP